MKFQKEISTGGGSFLNVGGQNIPLLPSHSYLTSILLPSLPILPITFFHLSSENCKNHKWWYYLIA